MTKLGTVYGVALALALGSWLAPRDAGADALAGKVFFSATKIKDASPKGLARLFAKSKPSLELKPSDGRWSAALVAFFRKPAVGGPVTIWFFDKGDKAALKNREPAHITTVQGGAPQGKLLVYDLELSNDDGFNKNHAYLIKVGQIIGKRARYYATGEVKLAP